MQIVEQMIDNDNDHSANYYKFDELKTYEQIKTFINNIGKQWEITSINLEYYNDHDTFNPPIFYKNLEEFNQLCKYFPNEEDLELIIFDMSRGHKTISGRISIGQNVFYTYEDRKEHHKMMK